MDDPLSRLMQAIPEDFFKTLEESTVSAFHEAHKLTLQRYDQPEQVAMIGQNRHALAEAAFRRAAATAGLDVHASHTDPRGGSYSWIGADGVYILRSNIQTSLGLPRPAKFRKGFSALNAWLDPVQLDLLRDVPMPSRDRICAMVVTTAFKPEFGLQDRPAFIGLGIPDEFLSRWHQLKPVNELLALYHDDETAKKSPVEISAEIKDNAIPRLKKKKN